MLKKVYRTLIATIFLVSIAMPAIAGSGPVEEKVQQQTEQMETAQVKEQAGEETKDMAEKGTDQEKQEAGQQMQEEHESPHK